MSQQQFTYIQPIAMRKQELAQLVQIPWQRVARMLRKNDTLTSTLESVGYQKKTKSLTSVQVQILFAHLGTPIADERTTRLVELITMSNGG